MTRTPERPLARGGPGEPESQIVARKATWARNNVDGPELYDVDIPIAPAMLYRVGTNAQRLGVEAGGVYDDKIATVAIYDRPWTDPDDPGPARLQGMLYMSTRGDRVFRVEVYPDAGGSFDEVLNHLERLLGMQMGEPVADDGRLAFGTD